MSAPAIAEGLFGLEPEPHLLGSECRACGTTTFPAQASCARCTAVDSAVVALPSRGTLWTWTLQGFAPKPPFALPVADFSPFPVGYVDLGGRVRAIGRLDVAPDAVEIGMGLRVAVGPLTFADGTEVLSYSFTPT